jgi:hypothetical protein
VTARGGDGVTRPVNREPQLLASLPDAGSWNPSCSGGGGCQASIVYQGRRGTLRPGEATEGGRP